MDILTLKKAQKYTDKQLDFPCTNLIQNGNFATDLSGWTHYNEKASWVDGRAYFNRPIGAGVVTLRQNFAVVEGHKFYFSADIENIKKAGGLYGIINNFGDPQRIINLNGLELGAHRVSTVFVVNTWGYLYINSVEGTEFYIDNLIMIDLTATFGAGNEPTAEEMDDILAKYPNGWFDGTVNPLLLPPEMFGYFQRQINKIKTAVVGLGGFDV